MSDTADSPAILVTVRSEIVAAALVAALQNRGVEAQFAGGDTSGFRVAVPGGVRIFVPRADLERAKTALQEIKADAADIDWSQVDFGEAGPDVQ